MVGAAEVVAVALVVLLAATVQGASGIGFALLAVPLLSVLALDARSSVLLANALGLITSGVLAARGRHEVDRPFVRHVLLGALLGIPPGLALILAVPDRGLKAAIGVAVLVSVALLASGRALHRETPTLEVAAGVCSGALNTALGTGGPPVTLLLQARRVRPGPFRATVSVVFVVLDVAAIILLSAGGVLDADVALAFAVALPALGAGSWVGHRLHDSIDPRQFRSGVLVLSAATGVIALVGAVTG